MCARNGSVFVVECKNAAGRRLRSLRMVSHAHTRPNAMACHFDGPR
jgi:hypothetical protein